MFDSYNSMSKWIIVFFICLVFAAVSTLLILLINFVLKKSVKIFPWLWRGPEHVGSNDSLLAERENQKHPMIKPDKVVTYGQNTFSCDGKKKKILIQTIMDSDGILLDYDDIISFEVLEQDDTADNALCGALSLKVRTSKSGYEEITLTYISAPEDRSGFAYTSASGAIKDVAAILDNISLINTV